MISHYDKRNKKTRLSKIKRPFTSKKLIFLIDYSKKHKIRIKYFLIAVVGFILSPLSWWNDLIVNIPLAYLFALPFGYLSEALFLPAMVVGYWITNIIGFILLHYGFIGMIQKKRKTYAKKQLGKDIVISVGYTFLVVALVYFDIVRLPSQYF